MNFVRIIKFPIIKTHRFLICQPMAHRKNVLSSFACYSCLQKTSDHNRNIRELVAYNVLNRFLTQISNNLVTRIQSCRNYSENLFDEQFFPSSVNTNDYNKNKNNIADDDNKFSGPPSRPGPRKQSTKTSANQNLFDQQYFSYSGQHDSKGPKHRQYRMDANRNEQQVNMDVDHSYIDSRYISYTKSVGNPDFLGLDSYVKDHYPEKSEEDTSESSSNRMKAVTEDERGTSNTVIVNAPSNLSRKLKNRFVPNIENPSNAFDVAMKIRKELITKNKGDEEDSKMKPQKSEESLDSKGFRILKDQVPDYSKVTSNIMLKIIKDSVIYNDGDVVAIDKPYGVATHGGPKVQHSVGKLLQELSNLLFPEGGEKLQILHRLDKECTGILLMARSPETISRIKKMFKDREVIKKYWVLTKGIPSLEEGVIDIPMREVMVDGQYRMGVIPERILKRKQIADTSEAITHYRVMDSRGSAAVIECQPYTGVKHQIRAHLAFGLNTPILGDHKYSHISKLAPQRVHCDILDRLKIRQSKVRHVPMHLHAKSIVLPNFLDGRNLFIRTNLPKHFGKNMKRLKLKPDKR